MARLPSNGQSYAISIPESYSPGSPLPVVVALHPYAEDSRGYGKTFLEALFEPGLRDLGAIIVAPDCPGTSWTTAVAEQSVLALMDHIEEQYAVDRSRTVITGYSIGGDGTWHLAARHRDRFSAAVPIAGEPRARSAGVQIPLCAIHSPQDNVVPLAPTQRAISQLHAKGVPVKLILAEGLSHYDGAGYVQPLRSAVPWIQVAWDSRNG
jgi:predicted peptidase